MQSRTVALALIALGAILLFAPSIASMTTVIYPGKFWYGVYPAGTKSSPTLWIPGQTVTLRANLVQKDTVSDIELPWKYDTWTVQVTIAETGQTVKLSLQGMHDNIEGRYKVLYYSASWKVPNEDMKTYTFNWLVILRDENNEEYARATTTTYAKALSTSPDGVFYINGKQVDPQTVLIVLEPTLKITFKPTKYPEKITDVKVEVRRGDQTLITTLHLTKSGGQYEATYTLPGAGTYRLDGWMTYRGAESVSVDIKKMSIAVSWGEEESKQQPFRLNALQIVGLCLMAFGVILLLRRRTV